MVNTSLVISARPDWTEELADRAPGAHVAVLADDDTVGVAGRRAGLHLRDTILVMRPGPRTSFVFIFRMPLVAATVAAQVMATGTGGMNINACRVSTGEHLGCPPRTSNAIYGGGKGTNLSAYDGNAGGRWPPNLVFVHGVGCHGGECEPGCPVALLDEQSGERRSAQGGGHQTGKNGGGIGFNGMKAEGFQTATYFDEGGASRFYPQFRDDAELHAWVTALISPSP
jgi:hypothetical protein